MIIKDIKIKSSSIARALLSFWQAHNMYIIRWKEAEGEGGRGGEREGERERERE